MAASTQNGQSLPGTQQNLSTSTSNSMYIHTWQLCLGSDPHNVASTRKIPNPGSSLGQNHPRGPLGLTQPAAHLCPPTTITRHTSSLV